MTGTHPDTPADPREVAHKTAIEAARTYARSIQRDLWAPMMFASNVATQVVDALMDAGLLSLSGDSTRDTGVHAAVAAQVKAYLASGHEMPFDARKLLWKAAELLEGSLRSQASGTPAETMPADEIREANP